MKKIYTGTRTEKRLTTVKDTSEYKQANNQANNVESLSTITNDHKPRTYPDRLKIAAISLETYCTNRGFPITTSIHGSRYGRRSIYWINIHATKPLTKNQLYWLPHKWDKYNVYLKTSSSIMPEFRAYDFVSIDYSQK